MNWNDANIFPCKIPVTKGKKKIFLTPVFDKSTTDPTKLFIIYK